MTGPDPYGFDVLARVARMERDLDEWARIGCIGETEPPERVLVRVRNEHAARFDRELRARGIKPEERAELCDEIRTEWSEGLQAIVVLFPARTNELLELPRFERPQAPV